MTINAWLTIPAQVAHLPVAAAWLHALGDEHCIPPAKLMSLDLCLDEALMNVVAHSGAAQSEAPIELQFQCHHADDHVTATVTVVDAGMPFNPLTVEPHTLPNHLDDAVLGGLGLRILRQNAQHLTYHFEDGKNRLTFGITWDTAHAPH